MVPLAAPVEPDGDQSQKGKALLGKLHGQPQDIDLEHQARQQPAVDPDHPGGLAQALPPEAAPEQVEQQNGEHTGPVIVHHGDGPRQPARQGHPRRSQEREPQVPPPLHPLYDPHTKQGDQEGPDHILVEREKGGPGVHQVEGDL